MCNAESETLKCGTVDTSMASSIPMVAHFDVCQVVVDSRYSFIKEEMVRNSILAVYLLYLSGKNFPSEKRSMNF